MEERKNYADGVQFKQVMAFGSSEVSIWVLLFLLFYMLKFIHYVDRLYTSALLHLFFTD